MTAYRALPCEKCGKVCGHIGELNRFGERKMMCCWCYAESDHKIQKNPTFMIKDFCGICVAREVERHYWELAAHKEQITLLQEEVKKLKEGRV